MQQEEYETGQRRVAEDGVPTVSAGGVAAGGEALPGTWLVAVVRRNSEKACRDELGRKGITAYVATQTMMRRYAKRRPKAVEYVRIPARVFVRMRPPGSGAGRAAFLRDNPYIHAFMTDRARDGRDWAEIPEEQMRQMREILGDTENEVTMGYPDGSYRIGGRVRAIGGAVHGLEGIVASREGRNYFCIEIKGLDWAKVCIARDRLQPLE